MQATFTRRLHKSSDVLSLKDPVKLFGYFNDFDKGRLTGVEIKQDEIRPVKVLDAGTPDMKRERSLIHKIKKCLVIINQRVLLRFARFTEKFDAWDPRWVIRRGIF